MSSAGLGVGAQDQPLGQFSSNAVAIPQQPVIAPQKMQQHIVSSVASNPTIIVGTIDELDSSTGFLTWLKHTWSIIVGAQDQPVAGAVVSQQAVISTEMVLYPRIQLQELVNERHNLLDEKLRLQKTIQENCQQMTQFLLSAKQKDEEISLLRESNASLQARIGELESRINALVLENSEIKSALDGLIEEREYDALVIILQDLNSMESLENKCPSFRKLRSSRVGACHFILEDDGPDCVQYKKWLSYTKLSNMSPKCRAKFDKLFKGAVATALSHLSSIGPPSDLTEDERSEADGWFL